MVVNKYCAYFSCNKQIYNHSIVTFKDASLLLERGITNQFYITIKLMVSSWFKEDGLVMANTVAELAKRPKI